jgi:type IV pilus assembly protein PilC
MEAELFYYRGRSPEGRRVSGSLSAADEGTALLHLQSRPLFVTSLQPAGAVPLQSRLWGTARSKRDARVIFFRSLATMVSAGVPIIESLVVAAGNCRDRILSEALASVTLRIQEGTPLSVALRSRPREFEPSCIALVAAGEASGTLDDVLLRLADTLEHHSSLRRKLIASLTYPAIVCAAAPFFIGLLMAAALPSLVELYAQLGVQTPEPLHSAIAGGTWLREHLAAVAALLAIVPGFAVLSGRRLSRLRTFAGRFVWHVPGAGALLRRAASAKAARTLGTLIRCGVDILQAVDVVAPVTGVGCLEEQLRSVKFALGDGESFSAAVAGCTLFDAFGLALIRAGETSGRLDSMLLRIADIYEAEVEASLQTFARLAEPLLLSLAGLVVAGIAITMFLPMYTLIGQIR